MFCIDLTSSSWFGMNRVVSPSSIPALVVSMSTRLPCASSGTGESIDLQYLWYVNKAMPRIGIYQKRRKLCGPTRHDFRTADRNSYASHVKRRQFVPEEPSGYSDCGDFLSYPGYGHRHDTGALYDASRWLEISAISKTPSTY